MPVSTEVTKRKLNYGCFSINNDTPYSGLGKVPQLDILFSLIVFILSIITAISADTLHPLLFFFFLGLPRIVIAIESLRMYYILYKEYYDDNSCKV